MVLDQLPLFAKLVTGCNREQLMQLLNSKKQPPDLLSLDLTMPRQNGFESFSEIKQKVKLKRLPVIIFSTSFEQHVLNLLIQMRSATLHFQIQGVYSFLKK
jgi:CheY-like chemotaxis protein